MVKLKSCPFCGAGLKGIELPISCPSRRRTAFPSPRRRTARTRGLLRPLWVLRLSRTVAEVRNLGRQVLEYEGREKMTATQLDVNVILTSQKNEEIEEDIDLALINIRDGSVDVEKIRDHIKKAIIDVLREYGDVDEFGEVQ